MIGHQSTFVFLRFFSLFLSECHIYTFGFCLYYCALMLQKKKIVCWAHCKMQQAQKSTKFKTKKNKNNKIMHAITLKVHKNNFGSIKEKQSLCASLSSLRMPILWCRYAKRLFRIVHMYACVCELRKLQEIKSNSRGKKYGITKTITIFNPNEQRILIIKVFTR